MGVGDVSKRILLGRKLRSSQLGETLLPKRIALPVFASDALSSVAYAPDEVFIMLALAGASAYVWSWKIAIAVALVMAAVIASYRQNVHAYPSGGGDYEVATVNLGRRAGVPRRHGCLARLVQRLHRPPDLVHPIGEQVADQPRAFPGAQRCGMLRTAKCRTSKASG